MTHTALAGRATLAKGGIKQQVAFPPPPSVAPAPPVEPIPVPGAPPAASFTTPGLEFGLNVVGYNAAAFTPALQTTLCNAITAASGITGASFLPCTVTGVVSLADPTQAAVYGYAAVQWYSAPTTTQLNFATAQIATLLQGLATNTSGIFAGTNLTVTPNCACDGNEVVTNPSTQAFGYSTIIGSNLPGAACDARLAPTASVGIDNGSVTPANRGKFCSSPQLVAGGVAGTPGTGSCAVYGVSTGVTTLSATATVDGLTPVGATVTNSGSQFADFPTIIATPGPATFRALASVDTVAVVAQGQYGAVPTVAFSGPGATSQATATAQMTLTTTGSPTSAGAGCPNDIYPVTVGNGGFTTAPTVTLTVVGGVATTLTVLSSGAGWTTSPTLFTIGTGANGNSLSSCTSTVAVDSADFFLGVASVTVTAPSRGYTSIPTISFTGGSQVTTAVAEATVKVTGVTVTGGENAYSAPPALLISSSPSSPATAATATALMGISISSITVVGGGSTYTSAPAVTITQGSGAGATAQAVVVGGAVSQVVVTAEGSGYLSIPSVFIAAPAASPSTVGLLCAASGQFIAASGSLPAVGIQTATGPSTASGTACAPMGIDTFASRTCSSPQLANGIIGVPGVATCGVVSSFVPAATSTIATTCALIPQAFTTTVTPGAPSPSPKAPSPKAPAPSPAAPACTYGGNYRMEAVGRAACGVEFPSYYGGSPANQTLCTTQSIQLRTEKQLPKVDRATFELASTGEIKTVRRGCAAGEAVWTPEGEKLRLLTTTTPKWKIEASAGDCNLVAIKSTATGTAAPYVSSPSPSGTQGCKSRQLFMTDKIYDTGRQLFRLRKV